MVKAYVYEITVAFTFVWLFQDGFYRVDHDYVVNTAKLAKDQGCSHLLLVSSTGANKNSWFLYPKTKVCLLLLDLSFALKMHSSLLLVPVLKYGESSLILNQYSNDLRF